jgi:hypothetical protein
LFDVFEPANAQAHLPAVVRAHGGGFVASSHSDMSGHLQVLAARKQSTTPKELSAIAFTPWDFITYGRIAIAILMLVRLTRKPDTRKTLAGKWTSDVMRGGTRCRTALSLDPDGNAEIRINAKSRDSKHTHRSNAQWRLLRWDTISLGAQTVTCRIHTLNSWRMTTATSADSAYSIRWIKYPQINTKPVSWLPWPYCCRFC